MAESWSVVHKNEDGGLVDSHEEVDLDDPPGQTGERSLFNASSKTHFGEDGISELREARSEGQYGERGQSNPTSQQDNQSPATEQVPPGAQAATPGSRPSTLFEPGSMVEVKGYGFGVVQWLGQLEGRETAGVELVCALYILVGGGGCSECSVHHRRSTGSSVGMVPLMEVIQCCSHANQDMLSSLP